MKHPVCTNRMGVEDRKEYPVSPPLFVLSVSAHVSASAGDGVSRTIFADVSSCGYIEGPVDAYSVVGVRLWNINWFVVLLLFGVCRANSDCAACSSVAIDFPLPSTTGSGQVVFATGSRMATPPTYA
ncbi:hypothetical protein Tco_0741318 [Tanacetum coccineum]